MISKFALFFTALLVLHSYARADQEFLWSNVEKSEIASGLRATGRVIPQDGALNIVSARVSGRVLSLLKREGEAVEIGTPLYLVSSAECTSLIEEKRVAESRALKDLIDGIKQRQTQMGLGITADGGCSVVANTAGVMTKRNIEVGMSFNPGDLLATILDTHHLSVELDIPENDLSKVKVNTKVTVEFAASPEKKYTTYLQNVVPVIDPTSRSSKVRLKPFAMPRTVTLDSLVFGEIQSNEPQALIKVPSSAVIFSQNQQYVIKGTADKPEAIAVTIVSEGDHSSLVRPLKEGALKVGDSVSVKGAIYLFQKMKSVN